MVLNVIIVSSFDIESILTFNGIIILSCCCFSPNQYWIMVFLYYFCLFMHVLRFKLVFYSRYSVQRYDAVILGHGPKVEQLKTDRLYSV